MAFWQSCGATLAEEARFCPACGRVQSAAAPAASTPAPGAFPEKYGMAALLSFFLPGLGQIVKGQIAKAILIWVSLVVFILLSFVVVGIPLLVVLWFWQIYDAYNLPQTR
jgi:TM2 domain-containing membrane protein YozV